MNYVELSGPMCRSCRNLLKSTDGCSYCLEVKPMLIWPVQQSIDHVESAQTSITDGLKVARRLIRKVSKRLDQEIGIDDEVALTRNVTAALRAMKELAAEQRKLEDRDHDHLANSTFEERIRLFVEQFFAVLPEHHQREFLRLCDELTALQSAPQVAQLTEGND